MKKVVFVSIDLPTRWSRWHSGNTDSVYYSEFLDTEDSVNEFIEQIKADYPDNNLIDGSWGHEFYIEYVVLDYNENNEKGFQTLRRMMRAYNYYNNRR